jgi:hypothetical protein
VRRDIDPYDGAAFRDVDMWRRMIERRAQSQNRGESTLLCASAFAASGSAAFGFSESWRFVGGSIGRWSFPYIAKYRKTDDVAKLVKRMQRFWTLTAVRS